MSYMLLSYCHNKRFNFKMAVIASAINMALASLSAQAAVTTTVTAQNNQEVTLTPGEDYLMSGRYALIANTSGKITGDGVTVRTNITSAANNTVGVINANSGGQIILTNSTISHLNPNNIIPSPDHTIAIRADGVGTLIDISNSTIESFHRLLQVTNGAAAKLTNNTIIAHRYGLQTIGAGSTLDIKESDVSILSTGVSVSARNGGLLTMTDSDIHAIGNYGVALSWDSNISIPNQTSASTGIFDNLTIETQLNNNTGYGIWLIGRSQALMDNSHIIINGSSTSGIFADRSQEMSQIRNTSIEMHGDNVNAVSVQTGSQISLTDGTQIVAYGNNTNALRAYHNNGASTTQIIASDIDITLEGTNSYGALTESNGSQIYLDDVRLTLNGNNSIGFFAKDAGTILHANRANVQVNSMSSTGMRVQNGADAQITNSQFNIAGAGSTGVVFSTASTNDSNSMQITGSVIETQDGYAIKNESGALNLTLDNSTVIGRTNGEYDVAIGITDSGGLQSGPVSITASGAHIIGDIVSQSSNANSTLNIALNNSSSLTGRLPFADSMTLDSTSRWNVTGDSTVTTLANNGSIAFASPSGSGGTFKTITVNGNYSGGGKLTINTTLDDDNSNTDKLIVNGDTSGRTGVFVNNFNGGGALTTAGIEVVSVTGQSNGTFALENRAVAGAYEYFLHQDNGNWYLRSVPYTVPPTEEGVYRPEAGGYISNMSAANRIFNLRLEDREGRAENSSMWLRQFASRNKSRDASGQLHMSANTYVIQGGGEVLSNQFGNDDRLGLGVMAAYGRTSGKTRSQISHYNAKNTLNGYSVGLYGTWYQNADSLNGAYVDGWMQYSWFDAKVHGEKLATENYHMNGLSASMETGYRVEIGQYRQSNLFITPQAQITWNGVKAGTHYETNGSRVDSNGSGNVQTRLGVKFSLDSAQSQNINNRKLFTVYSEANWLYNTENVSVTMDGVQLRQKGNRNIGELKLGVEGELSQQLSVWANVAQQLGSNGYRDTAANVGIKYQF